jgi:hypothetical protein
MMKTKIPCSASFPITFEHALRLAAGGREVEPRYALFRRWWKSELHRVAKTTGAFSDNTDQVVLMFRRDGVSADWFTCMCAGIADYKYNRGVEQRRSAANARWKKENQKKRPRRPIK